jgi:pantoate--beta-alanine ligase
LSVEVIQQPAAWRERLDTYRSQGRRVGLVPTMGALHAGHMSLIRRAAGDGGEQGVVAVTDYVNPLQFGAGEDLAGYPRDLEGDVATAEAAGADVVFAPEPGDLWPDGPGARLTSVAVAEITAPMEGEHRPGHFDGVATIVAKLFGLTGPCRAYFGEKDYQQLAVIRRMADDLSLPVDVIGCPTVRDPDGLALSSRNAYLSAEERQVAPLLYYSLLAGKRAIEDDGIDDPDKIETLMTDALGSPPERFRVDYARVADPDTLARPLRVRSDVRLLAAARLGRARLIDNVSAHPPTPSR